jgi:hypothetical protein
MNEYELLKKYKNSNELLLTKWDSIESRVPIQFPNWFKRFNDLFDKAMVNDFIKVYSPCWDFGEELLEFKEDFYTDLFTNEELISDKRYLPKNENMIPFAETNDKGYFFWVVDKPDKVVYMNSQYATVTLDVDFNSLILNENGCLKQLDFYNDSWVEDFHIETNLSAKYIKFFIKPNMANYQKTRECVLKNFDFKFKEKTENLSEHGAIIETFDASRKENCIIKLTNYSDTRVSIEIRYPIAYYDRMFAIIKEFEKLNFYIVGSGHYYKV